MITATLTDINGTLTLPPIEKQFIKAPIENAVDVETLDGAMYTDFTSKKDTWTFNFDSMSQATYDAIKAKYDAQFTTNDYPELSISFYSLSNKPVRMYINEQDIWNNCGDVQNVVLTFREAS
jgi:hypothetical protein